MQHQFCNLLTCFVLIGLLTACKPITLPPDVTPTAVSEEMTADENDIPPITAIVIPTLSDSVQQEVMEAEQELNYASDFTHDLATAQRMFADDYQDSDGNDKERKLASIERASYHGKSAEYTEVEFVVDGDTATLDFTIKTTEAAGYSFVQQYTNVWMKRDGQWQLVTSNWR